MFSPFIFSSRLQVDNGVPNCRWNYYNIMKIEKKDLGLNRDLHIGANYVMVWSPI